MIHLVVVLKLEYLTLDEFYITKKSPNDDFFTFLYFPCEFELTMNGNAVSPYLIITLILVPAYPYYRISPDCPVHNTARRRYSTDGGYYCNTQCLGLPEQKVCK